MQKKVIKTKPMFKPSHLSANIKIVNLDPHELTLRVRCARGYQCGYLKLRPDMFDAHTMDQRLKEYPSGRTVLSKGWDVFNGDIREEQMATPCFTPWLNGKDLGDVWFDMPDYLDYERGVLEAEFGFYVFHPGIVDLRLAVVKDHRRNFHWGMLETIQFKPDNRAVLPLPPLKKISANPHEPWLFLHGKSSKEARALFRENSAASQLPRMLRLIQAGHQVPFINVNELIPIAAFLTDSPEWIALGRKLARDLCSEPTWSARRNPRVMHGDNDTEPGRKLVTVAMIAQFLWNRLDNEERQLILSKTREYGHKFYEFSVLNKRWASGMGGIGGHQCWPLLGLAYCAMTFYHDIAEAPEWLAWAHGRFVHAITYHGPQDGLGFWKSYATHYWLSYAAAVQDFGHCDLFKIPYLAHVAGALLRTKDTPLHVNDADVRSHLMARQIMSVVAEYTGNAHAAWGWHWYWQMLNRLYGKKHFAGWWDFLWKIPQGKAPSDDCSRSFLFKDTGIALLRSPEKDAPRFCCIYQSGHTGGRYGFPYRNRYSQGQAPGADGGIMVLVNGVFVINRSPSSYMQGFHNESVVTVDGGGHYRDGMWCSAVRESWLSKMILFKDSPAKTVAVGENTRAYRAELGVIFSRRMVTLSHRDNRLTIADAMRLRAPRQIAALYHCSGTIRQIDAGRFEFTSGNMAIESRNDALKDIPLQRLELTVRAPERYDIRICEPQMVLSYGFGMNAAGAKKIGNSGLPRRQFLKIAVPGKTAQADFRVEIKPLLDD